MKKPMIMIAILMGLSVSAQAFTITNIGTVQSREYNELLDRMIKSDLKVWAGVDSQGYELVKFDIDGGLKNMGFALWKPKEGDDTTATLYGYEKWDFVLSKALEWGEIAQTNAVDHSAEIGDCSTVDIKCTAKFVSISNGDTVWVEFDMEDKDNQFYKAEPVVLLEDIRTLDNLFRVGAPAHWEKVRNQATKDKSNLFN